MTRLPAGYHGPHDPGRDPAMMMRDPAAERLIAMIVQLHDDLAVKLDHAVELAALGACDPASGPVSGSGNRDHMGDRVAAVRKEERDRQRQLKNARRELLRVVEFYERRHGLTRPNRATTDA